MTRRASLLMAAAGVLVASLACPGRESERQSLMQLDDEQRPTAQAPGQPSDKPTPIPDEPPPPEWTAGGPPAGMLQDRDRAGAPAQPKPAPGPQEPRAR